MNALNYRQTPKHTCEVKSSIVESKLPMHKNHTHTHIQCKERTHMHVRTHTHTHTHTFTYMHREIKDVVRRCLLPWLIKNSVNEAALSPQIEQMNKR